MKSGLPSIKLLSFPYLFFSFFLFISILPNISQAATNLIDSSAGMSSALIANPSQSQLSAQSPQGTYTMMAPLGRFFGPTVDVSSPNALTQYLLAIYKMGIAAATALAVIMITVGGIEYAMSQSIGGKNDGKKKVQNALTGLLLALTTVILLGTINRNLVSTSFILVPVGPIAGVGAGVSTGGVAGAGSSAIVGGDEASLGANASEYTTNTGGTATPAGQWTGGGDANTFISGLPNESSRAQDGSLNISSYGSSQDSTPDSGTLAKRGDNDNLLVPGSVALSPDLVSQYNPPHGASVSVNGTLIGYYDDKTDSSYNGTPIKNTIDVYDPQGTYGSGVLKDVPSGSYNLTFGPPRQQTSNPSH